MNREFFWDEDVLRIQNEVRRYKNEQKGIYDGDVDDQMQRIDSSGSDSDNVSGESRGDFLQDASAGIERE